MTGKRMFLRIVAGVVLLGGALGRWRPAQGEEPAALGVIEAGKPTYRARTGEAWREKSRIVGRVRNAPVFEADVLDDDGRIVKSFRGKPGARAYEIEWLAPGVYALRVNAKGYRTLALEGLEVKAGHDLVVPLEFSAAREGDVGALVGILTAKGRTWIEVKAEGQAESKRYRPLWRGGAPADGGGFDEDMLKTITGLIVTNLVRLEWKFEEHLRVTKVEMIVPDPKEGTVTGAVTARGRAWIDVKPQQEGVPTERYMPRWIGGLPKDGGGLDKDMLRLIAGFKVGDRVRVRWAYDERKRVVELVTLAPEDEDDAPTPKGKQTTSRDVRRGRGPVA